MHLRAIFFLFDAKIGNFKANLSLDKHFIAYLEVYFNFALDLNLRENLYLAGIFNFVG